MTNIVPISDLKNYSEVLRSCDDGATVYLTKNGRGKYVVQSLAEYEKLQDSAISAARRGYVDSIITPADTRKYVIGAFEMLDSKSIDATYRKHGTV